MSNSESDELDADANENVAIAAEVTIGAASRDITTVLPFTAVFFRGTYHGAKSVVPCNTRAGHHNAHGSAALY